MIDKREEIRIACLTIASKATHLGPTEVVNFAKCYEEFVLDEASHAKPVNRDGTISVKR